MEFCSESLNQVDCQERVPEFEYTKPYEYWRWATADIGK